MYSQDELTALINDLDSFLQENEKEVADIQDANTRLAVILMWSTIATAVYGRKVLHRDWSDRTLCVFVPHAAVMLSFYLCILRMP